MNKRGLDYIKRNIKRTYKRYIGERTDGVATIADVAKLFCIELDGSRLDDFCVKTIDFNVPSIVIIDKATMTTYRAEFTSNAVMFGNIGGEVKYVYVTSHNEVRSMESLYCLSLGEDYPHVATFITMRENDLELTFTKERTHNLGISGNVGDKFKVGYNKVLENDIKLPLLTKVYKYFAGDYVHTTMEDIYTYGNRSISYPGDVHDRFVFADAMGVDFVIKDFISKNVESGELDVSLDGFCFENMSKYEYKRMPFPTSMNLLNENNSPLLYSPKTKSAIHFKGWASQYVGCNFEVYKSNEGLRVIYKAIMAGDVREVKYDDDFFLPVLSPGNISIEEIDSLIGVLNLKYDGDGFIRQAIMQLLEFRRKICINRGLTLKEEDALSPEVFLGMTVEELERTVVENRETYFDEIMKQFQNSTHLSTINPRDIKSFRMMPKKD